MKYTLTTIDTIFSKLIRDYGNDFSEGDVIEWTGEALAAMDLNRSYEEAVAFIEVKEHQCEMPLGLHAVIQIAKDNEWCGPKSDELCPERILQEVCPTPATDCGCGTTDCGCSTSGRVPDYIVLDCNGMPLNDYDIAYYRPYFDLKAEYYGWSNSPRYRNRYSPITISTNSFNDSLVCSGVTQYENRYSGDDKYTITGKGRILRFSFREGSVAVAFLRQPLDPETGYPLVPDTYSVQAAIVHYIIWKSLQKQSYQRRDGSGPLAKQAEDQWQWYCKQAVSKDMMPQGVDEHQELLNQRSYILPRQYQYYSFFGNLGDPETRKYNNPDRRVRNY